MGEAEEIESRRADRIAPAFGAKVEQPRLVRMQGEAVSAESLRQDFEHTPRVLFPREDQDS
jgi:hypothetical protein